MESSPPIPASIATNLDVVLLPFPSQGHLNPFMLIARLLANRGFNCTIVLSQKVYNMVMKEETTSSSSSRSNGIQFVAIREDSLPARSTMSLGNKAMSGFDAALHLMLKMRAGFEDWIKNLPCPPCCLIADAFVLWSQESAHKLGLPRVTFFTAAAFSFTIMFHFPMLFSKGLVPFTDASYENPQYFIDCIPGMPPLRPIDFSDSMRNMPQFILQVADLIETDAAVLLNTTYELEKEPLDALQKSVHVFPIGPLLLLCEERSSHIVNFWTEETECLNWLDAQSPSSVLYVSFGSMASMPAKQLIELAEGLEASQQRFLWVLRPDAVMGSESFVVPEGFTERTKDRGLIISWAPQLQVLAHPSLGGFLTHCGWNSTIENVSVGGVPMICWPCGAEQRLNCRLTVDIWKIGIEFSKREDGIVVKGEVERALRAVMEGEEGRGMKVRAVKEGGSSFKYLEAFVKSIKMKAQQAQQAV